MQCPYPKHAFNSIRPTTLKVVSSSLKGWEDIDLINLGACSKSCSHESSNITLFSFITIFYESDNIAQNIQKICLEHCLSHKTLLWIRIMLWTKTMRSVWIFIGLGPFLFYKRAGIWQWDICKVGWPSLVIFSIQIIPQPLAKLISTNYPWFNRL